MKKIDNIRKTGIIMNVGNFKHGSVVQLFLKRGFSSLGKQTHLIKQKYDDVYTIQTIEKKKKS